MSNYRYTRVPGADNKFSVTHREIQNPGYAASLTVAATSPDTEEILVDFKKLTGALALTAATLFPKTGDKLKCLFQADTTNRVVTPGVGFIGVGTITVLANKFATVEYTYKVEASAWLEVSRFVQS